MQTSALLTEMYYLYGKDDLGNTVIFRTDAVHRTGEGSTAGKFSKPDILQFLPGK